MRKIYGPIDSAIADGIAIEKENSIFVVDSGIEDGKIDFGVRHQFKIDDANLRLKNLEEINDRAISKGYVDNEISKRIRHSSNNGSRGSIERKLSEELSDNTRKSENNESRISGKDATDGSRRLKFSLKDSEKALNERVSGLKEIIRNFIYEYEQDRNAQTRYALEDMYGEEIIGQFTNADFPNYRTLKERKRSSRSGESGRENYRDNQRELDGRRDFNEDSGTIKLSRKDKVTYTLSDWQIKKKVANFTKLKVYSKVEAETSINSILETIYKYFTIHVNYAIIN